MARRNARGPPVFIFIYLKYIYVDLFFVLVRTTLFSLFAGGVLWAFRRKHTPTSKIYTQIYFIRQPINDRGPVERSDKNAPFQILAKKDDAFDVIGKCAGLANESKLTLS